jgi:hypothetical protein
MSQMDKKHKTCDIRTWKKHLLCDISSTNIGCPIALPEHRNPQPKILLTVVSAISALLFQPLCHQLNVCHQGGNFST